MNVPQLTIPIPWYWEPSGYFQLFTFSGYYRETIDASLDMLFMLYVYKIASYVWYNVCILEQPLKNVCQSNEWEGYVR